MEEALPRAAEFPGPRLRLLLLPPDSRSWFISKSQLATSWTFARLSEEEKGLAFCKRDTETTGNKHQFTLLFLSTICYPASKQKSKKKNQKKKRIHKGERIQRTHLKKEKKISVLKFYFCPWFFFPQRLNILLPVLSCCCSAATPRVKMEAIVLGFRSHQGGRPERP